MLLTLGAIFLFLKDASSSFKREGNDIQCGYVTLCRRTTSHSDSCADSDYHMGERIQADCERQQKYGNKCQVIIIASDTESFGFIRETHSVHENTLSGNRTQLSLSGQQCIYEFHTKPGQKIKFDFKHFEFPGSWNNCQDYVEIFKARIAYSYHQKILCNATCTICGSRSLEYVSVTSMSNWTRILTYFRPNLGGHLPSGSRQYGFQALWSIIGTRPIRTNVHLSHHNMTEGYLGINNESSGYNVSTRLYPAIDHTHHIYPFSIGPIVGGCVVLGFLVVIFLAIHTCIIRNKARRNNAMIDSIIPYAPEQIQMHNLCNPPAYTELRQAPPPYPGSSGNLTEGTPLNSELEIPEAPPPYSDDSEPAWQNSLRGYMITVPEEARDVAL